MSMELIVLSNREVRSTAEWQSAIDAESYPHEAVLEARVKLGALALNELRDSLADSIPTPTPSPTGR